LGRVLRLNRSLNPCGASVVNAKIAEIDAIADPARVHRIAAAVLPDE
jgi:hypothetical protein